MTNDYDQIETEKLVLDKLNNAGKYPCVKNNDSNIILPDLYNQKDKRYSDVQMQRTDSSKIDLISVLLHDNKKTKRSTNDNEWRQQFENLNEIFSMPGGLKEIEEKGWVKKWGKLFNKDENMLYVFHVKNGIPVRVVNLDKLRKIVEDKDSNWLCGKIKINRKQGRNNTPGRFDEFHSCYLELDENNLNDISEPLEDFFG